MKKLNEYRSTNSFNILGTDVGSLVTIQKWVEKQDEFLIGVAYDDKKELWTIRTMYKKDCAVWDRVIEVHYRGCEILDEVSIFKGRDDNGKLA